MHPGARQLQSSAGEAGAMQVLECLMLAGWRKSFAGELQGLGKRGALQGPPSPTPFTQ